jgi:ElaB/YqjD/DUF883 family membrane-anchored ribosome-binding protein
MSKRFVLIVAAVALLAVMVGCSKPPEAEMQKAQQALDAAKAAEAETYVPDSYNAALDSFNAAESAKKEQDSKFALFRSYGKSKEMFASAEQMLNNVTSEAVTKKDEVRQEVEAALISAKAVVDSADAALAKAPRGKGSRADIELIKNDFSAVQAGYDDAKNDVDGGQYMTAKTKIETVVDNAHKIIDEIAKARKGAGKSAM